MINNKSIVALIPARGGSKGLPRKNVMILSGLPLVGWPILAAKKSNYIDRVIVTTDDVEIAKVAMELGAEVPFMRPAELASDTASSASVIRHAIAFLEAEGNKYEYIVLLEPTSPLTESTDVDAAIEMLEAKRDIADSIAGVSKVVAAHPVYDVVVNEKGLIEPFVTENFSAVGRRQDLSELYFFDGSLYISDVMVFLEKNSFYHNRTLPFIVPKWKSYEVDDLVDFLSIEAIMNNVKLLKGNTSQ